MNYINAESKRLVDICYTDIAGQRIGAINWPANSEFSGGSTMTTTSNRYNARSGSVQKDIDQAIRRVYQEYGPDFSGLVRAVETKLARERCDRMIGLKHKDQNLKQHP
jgi:hypothetical protein